MITRQQPEPTVPKAPTTAKRGKRLSAAERERIGRRAVDLYNQGSSVRDVRVAIGWSYGATHRLLHQFGAAMRGRGSGGRRRR